MVRVTAFLPCLLLVASWRLATAQTQGTTQCSGGHCDAATTTTTSASMDDDTVLTGADDSDAVRCSVVNQRSSRAGVYWRDLRPAASNPEMLVMELAPGETADLDTFLGHSFVVRDITTANRVKVHEFVVRERQQREVLSSPDTAQPQELLSRTLSRHAALGNQTDKDVTKALVEERDSCRRRALNIERTKGISARRVTFFNNLDEPVDLVWVSPDRDSTGQRKEIAQATIAVGVEHGLDTYTHHEFRLKRHSDGSIVNEVSIVPHKTHFWTSLSSHTPFHQAYQTRFGRPWLNVAPRWPVEHYMYPAMRPGDTVQVEVQGFYDFTTQKGGDESRLLSLRALSVRPRIFEIDDFLSAEECDHIIQVTQASGRLARSTVATQGKVSAKRTSSTAWLKFAHTPALQHIFRRGFKMMNIPFDGSNSLKLIEELQVVKYDFGEEYQPHYDYFPPFDGESVNHGVRQGHNRFATLFLYLNDVGQGGETVFPRHGGVFTDHPCKHALRVTPKRGKAILFYSLLPDGNLDEHSVHGSCPVLDQTTKWGANWWFWDRRKY